MIQCNKTCFAFGLVLILVSTPVSAQSFDDVLISAYEFNPTLDAAKQDLRAVNEKMPQALAGYRPSLSSFVRAGTAYEFTADDGDDAGNATAAAGVTLTQPLYRGGRTSAGVDRAENEILAQREVYRAAEQDVLLQAGFVLVTLKLVVIGVFLFITGPSATHAIANAALVRGSPDLKNAANKKSHKKDTSA